MQCSQCNTENPQKNKFCQHCGASLLIKCPSCGETNSAETNFCGNCGTKLKGESAAPEEKEEPSPGDTRSNLTTPELIGERKQVTVLFAEISVLPEVLATHDLEDVRLVYEPGLFIMMNSVHEYGGTVIKATNRSIMALFGAPVAYEHHTLRASYAALSMQQKMRLETEEITITVGLNTGEVVVDTVGTTSRQEYDAFGAVVNIAARMQQTAESNVIQITQAVLDVVEDKIQFQSLGEKEIKGIHLPLKVFELKGILQEYSAFRTKKGVLLTPFVNRKTEILVFRNKLQQAIQGKGNVLGVRADSGQGKSRLLYELGSLEEAKSLFKVETHGYFIRKNTPFYPAKQLVKQLFSITDTSSEGGAQSPMI